MGNTSWDKMLVNPHNQQEFTHFVVRVHHLTRHIAPAILNFGCEMGGDDMETEQNYTDWDIAERSAEETQNDTFTVFFYELLSEQRY